jgi:hypothetical protein
VLSVFDKPLKDRHSEREARNGDSGQQRRIVVRKMHEGRHGMTRDEQPLLRQVRRLLVRLQRGCLPLSPPKKKRSQGVRNQDARSQGDKQWEK